MPVRFFSLPLVRLKGTGPVSTVCLTLHPTKRAPPFPHAVVDRGSNTRPFSDMMSYKNAMVTTANWINYGGTMERGERNAA